MQSDQAVFWQTVFLGLGFLASAAAAAGTIFLAFKTASLADETKRMADKTAELAAETRQSLATAQDELRLEMQRHLDAFQPHIAIQTEDLTRGHVTSPSAGIGLYLVNVGPGYAHDIELDFDAGEMSREDNRVIALATKERVLIARSLNHQPTVARIRVTYLDAFNRKFESIVDGAYKPGQTYRFIRHEMTEAN